MARARFSVLDPAPLRKIDRHTRVSRRWSKYWSTVFAMSDPHEGIPRQRRYVGRTIYQQIAIVVQPDPFPRQRLGRRTLDLLSACFELAAVTGTGNHVELRLPRRQAAQVRAHRA